MNVPPRKLFTSNLSLERAGPGDFWGVWDIWSEPDISQRVFGERTGSLDAAINAYDAWMAGSGSGLGVWIVRSSGGRTLGCVSLARRQFSVRGGSQLSGPVEFQIAFKASARGRGLGHEAARALIRQAFCDTKLLFIAASSNGDDTDAGVNLLLSRLGFQVTAEYVEEHPLRLGHMLTRESFHGALTAPMPLA